MGPELEGIRYEQLIPWVKPEGDAFRVIVGDYVTTSDGTGIVHIAPTFGADDDRVAKVAGIPPLFMVDRAGKNQPMVDRQGKFFLIEDLDPEFVKTHVDAAKYGEYAGRYVKNAYDERLCDTDPTLDIDIAVMLKTENKAFKIEKHTHSYPHCWRTDKPVLYYPLDSWFVRTTALRDKMIELNKTIRWKPESTGTGRFGKWLEGLVDWNLSRSRFWGTPLPVWATEDYSEVKCIGSVEELMGEIERSIAAGVMQENPYKNFRVGDMSKENYSTANIDLHRPYVDSIVLVSSKGEPMKRESDLIDVWFDSGAMPYAQVHYPFENKGGLQRGLPRGFHRRGRRPDARLVLHAARHRFDAVRLGGLPKHHFERSGARQERQQDVETPGQRRRSVRSARHLRSRRDALVHDLQLAAVGQPQVRQGRRRRSAPQVLRNALQHLLVLRPLRQRGRLHGPRREIPMEQRPEIDRWIISLLNTLVKNVTESLENYDPTPAARAIQEFVGENLSNWYVRLNRKRFWGGGMSEDKLAAYQTLYTCLETVTMLAAPFAPFISDRIFTDLNAVSGRHTDESVHLAAFPKADERLIDARLEEMMSLAQKVSSMVLALRRKVSIKVRQPLTKILIPVLDPAMAEHIAAVKNLIMGEVNVKEVELIEKTTGLITKRIKPNFKTLGPRYGKWMKQIAALTAEFSQERIAEVEAAPETVLDLGAERITVTPADFEITSEDMPGWLVASEGKLTVALDITVTEELKAEGVARELINRIQNIRKDSGFEVTDKIRVEIEQKPLVADGIARFAGYIASQTLAVEVRTAAEPAGETVVETDVDDEPLRIAVTRI